MREMEGRKPKTIFRIPEQLEIMKYLLFGTNTICAISMGTIASIYIPITQCLIMAILFGVCQACQFIEGEKSKSPTNERKV